MRYYSKFPWAIPHLWKGSHVLLTRLPLPITGAFDLHVLGLPPAFVLSQDQTLRLKEFEFRLVPGHHPRAHCVTGTFTVDFRAISRPAKTPMPDLATDPGHLDTNVDGDGMKRSVPEFLSHPSSTT